MSDESAHIQGIVVAMVEAFGDRAIAVAETQLARSIADDVPDAASGWRKIVQQLRSRAD